MKKIDSKHFYSKPSGSSLGSKIEALRKNNRYSQLKLAELLGVSRASVSLYETNAGRPSFKVLEKLAEVLGVPLLELAAMDYNENAAAMRSEPVISSTDRAALIKEYFGRDESYVEVEFMIEAIADFSDKLNQTKINRILVEVNQQYVNEKVTKYPSALVLAIAGVEYCNSKISIILDNTMGPRYPKASRHILHPISNKSSWQYLTGLHGFSIKGQTTILRRIINNNHEGVVLADYFDNKMIVSFKDVEMIWKVGQAVHMPPED